MSIILIGANSNMGTEKFARNKRTFETRLLFIKSVFENKYSNKDILASSIKYKLENTYKQYEYDVHQSALVLKYEDDPLKILKKLNKET